MDNSQTLFLHSTMQRFYAPYSYILASTETPVTKYKDWVTLSAGSGYSICLFFFSSQASTALTAQSTRTPHKNTHTHCHLLFHTSKSEALPGLSTIANMALLFFSYPSAGSHQSLLWQLRFWYLYFHWILITLCFICHPSLLACPWPRAAVLFYNGSLRYWLFPFDTYVSLQVFSSGH